MKVLLQRKRDEKFLAHGGRWVEKPEAAEDLKSSIRAMDVAKNVQEKRVRIVLRFCGDSRYDIKLELNKDENEPRKH